MPPVPPPTGPFDTSTTLGSGNDTFLAGATNDFVSGGDGRDSLSGGEGNDYLDGGAGNDTLLAGRGDDTLVGGDGDDRLLGGVGNQLLFGGSGNDSLQSGDRDSTLDGGVGNDTLVANAAKGAAIELAGGTGADRFLVTSLALDRDAIITLTDFDPSQDTLTLDGVSLSTVLNQGRSWTLLEGGGIEILLSTGDILRFTGTPAEALWRSFGLAGADSLTGSIGNDRVFTGGGNDTVTGGEGDDFVFGDDGNDLIFGDGGDDRLNGARGNDTIHGGEGDDLIEDSRGTNLFYGGGGNDTVYSGLDSSVVHGDDGDDTLVSRGERGGDHHLYGGLGADLFDFVGISATSATSNVTIHDFDLGVDSLRIMGQEGLGWIQVNGLGWEDTEEGLVITYIGGSITFAGLTSEDLAPWLPVDTIF